MDWDDIVYLFLLGFCIGFGQVFRSIEDRSIQKNISTLVGFLIVYFTSGRHILHILICIVVNWLIIQCFSKKKIHIYSFGFSFLYLLFFRTTEYFGIPYAPSHTNLVQMILTLKLVGLAFEIHDSEEANAIDSPTAVNQATQVSAPSLIETIHYSFCYIGVLAGPYFSYRTFYDYFKSEFARNAPCQKATVERALLIPLYSIAFLISSTFFPLKYVTTDEFMYERSLTYRLLYIFPTFFTFRMRMYIGMRLAECVFTMSGMGAYPTFTKPKPGQGPTVDHTALMSLYNDERRAKLTEYSFDTIHNIEPRGAELEYTVRNSMKHWNMTVQFWLAKNVYKRFPYKAYRMPLTFFISSFWHGIYAGHYMCLTSVPFYLPIEDIYIKNLRDPSRNPMLEKACWLVAYSWRMMLMGYWGAAFCLLHVGPALSFWYSLYFIPTLISLVMYAASYVLFVKPSHVFKNKFN